MLLAADWGVGEVLWSIVWFTLFFIWIWLFISVAADIFRSHDLGGWAKALWLIFVIFAPYLGVFVYLIARGHKMSEHALEQAKRQEAMQREYIQSVAGAPNGSSAAEQIAKAAELRDKGAITEEEFQALKAKALS